MNDKIHVGSDKTIEGIPEDETDWIHMRMASNDREKPDIYIDGFKLGDSKHANLLLRIRKWIFYRLAKVMNWLTK